MHAPRIRRGTGAAPLAPALFAVILVAAACDPAATPGMDCSLAGTCPEGLSCFPDWRCWPASAPPACDPACYGAEPHCLPGGLRCVECLVDSDCPAGTVCVAPNYRCLPGCRAGHATCANDGTVCDVDMGVCHGCLSDSDCGGATPRCDAASGTCGACATAPDSCPAGSYCAAGSDGALACTPGCKGASECPGKSPGCCDHRCVDVSSDSNACGVCGYHCASGKVCCGGLCADVSSNVDHCAACDTPCTLPNAKGLLCVMSMCQWNGTCEDYFANCDGNAKNGCETNLTQDPNNCYGCGARCPPWPHAAPYCTVNGCRFGPCDPGWADCDGQAGNGCEYATSGFASDGNNCGACNVACTGKQQCVMGKCV